MPKVVAYVALHYGSDYLGWAIRSVIDYVDELWVLYAAEGSHGHRTSMSCPDDGYQLKRIARAAAGFKLRWYESSWLYEGAQRDSIFQLASTADVIIALDADEIWPAALVEQAIDAALTPDVHGLLYRQYHVPIIHYWRSFNRAVLHDPAYPVRVTNPRIPNGATTIGSDLRINHMGYAQRSEITRYKLETHGHKGEFRRDCDWFTDVFMANRQTDYHPVGSEYWNIERVNPLDYMPPFMVEHPYYGMELIP